MTYRLLGLSLLLAACGGAADSTRVEEPALDPVVEDERPDEDEGGDEDGVELVSTRGKMDPADIEAALQPHAAALEDCYASAVGRNKWLGGAVSIHWHLDKTGALVKVQLETSDLGSWPIEKCLLDVARAMTFPAPRGGPADFSIPLEFSARGSAQWWEPDRAEAVVSKRKAELAECAAEAGVADPGDVTVTVYVGTRGKVQAAGFSSPAVEPIADAWADCAHARVMAWTLSDPKGKVAKLAFKHNPGVGVATEDGGDVDEGSW